MFLPFLRVFEIRTLLTISCLLFTSYCCSAQIIFDPDKRVFVVTKNTDSQVTTLSYQDIDQVPLFKGCNETSTQEEQKQCTASKIIAYVNRKFRFSVLRKMDLGGLHIIEVKFQIDTLGKVINIRSESNLLKLAEEGARVVSRLPRMQPARHEGKIVPISYTLPIRLKFNKPKQTPENWDH